MTAMRPGQDKADLTSAPIRATDGLVGAILGRLAAVPPERGAALLATGGLIHLLVEDTSARYSRASWDISAALSETVAEIEAAGHGTLAGTVHTHPAGVPDPSGTDIATTRDALELNPHLGWLVIAIVTKGAPREHDLRVGPDHRMSLHVLRRDHMGQTSLVRVRGSVALLTADLAAAGITIVSATSIRAWRRAERRGPRAGLPTVVLLNHSPRLAIPVPSPRPAALLIHPGYPETGPIAVTGRQDAGTPAALQSLPSPWDPVAPPGPQLAALARAVAGRRIAGSTKRVWPLVGALSSRQVLVAGAGSVGSRIAEELVRSGVGAFTVIDPDRVDAPNLARTIYTAADIGVPKPDALVRRLQAIDPAVVVDRHCAPLGTIDLARAVARVSLVVAATDDMAEQAVLAHHAYAAGVPLVACALYKKAAAGEVVLSVPAAGTACWRCAVGAGTPSDSYRPAHDYGLGGRLAGESALGPSIHLVADVAASVALGLLAGPGSQAGRYVKRLLSQRRTLGLIATTPAWGFFRTVFAGMDHQHAPQSVWVRVDPDAGCPVCGACPIPPLDVRAGSFIAQIISEFPRASAIPHPPTGHQLEQGLLPRQTSAPTPR
jgi:molybdopterin/thiamine biosynthesis adenylyltransferase/proteasome lid subunit RPN8/RPN11